MDSRTTIVNLRGDDGKWSGVPDEGTGVFMLADRFLARFLELRLTIMPESVMGLNKPVLSMRYQVVPLTGVIWEHGELEGHLKWGFQVRDDVGTEYEVWGGASGFGVPDATTLVGDVDFEPEVPSSARQVEVRFMDSRHGDELAHRVVANLPPLS